MLQFVGSQRVRQDFMTEQQQGQQGGNNWNLPSVGQSTSDNLDL